MEQRVGAELKAEARTEVGYEGRVDMKLEVRSEIMFEADVEASA